MELEEAKRLVEELLGYLRENEEYVFFHNAIETVLQELDRLQKENYGKDCLIETQTHNEEVHEKYIEHLEKKLNNSISKDKIREKIEKIKENEEGYAMELQAKIDVLNDLLKEE